MKQQVAKLRARPTIVDVARDAGVSAATVSNAMNGRRYVGERTRTRVERAAARLGYTPNVHARRMRVTGTGTVGMFSAMPFAISGRDSRLGFFMELAAGAAVFALERGFALALVPPTARDVPPAESLAIDAALIVEPATDDPYVEQLRKRGIPIVTIGRYRGPAPAAPAVDLRSAATARLLLAHLYASNGDRIALITGSARRTAYTDAERVYARFAAERGMAPVAVRVDEEGGEDAAFAAALELFERHPRTNAILVTVDTFASGVVRAAREAGRAIPRDLRVATRYDGIRARESTPPLTAVDLQLDIVAGLAIALLVDRLTGRSSVEMVRAPLPKLVVRASSATG